MTAPSTPPHSAPSAPPRPFVIAAPEVEATDEDAEVVDLVAALQKSLEASGRKVKTEPDKPAKKSSGRAKKGA